MGKMPLRARAPRRLLRSWARVAMSAPASICRRTARASSSVSTSTSATSIWSRRRKRSGLFVVVAAHVLWSDGDGCHYFLLAQLVEDDLFTQALPHRFEGLSVN